MRERQKGVRVRAEPLEKQSLTFTGSLQVSGPTGAAGCSSELSEREDSLLGGLSWLRAAHRERDLAPGGAQAVPSLSGDT